jgi:hypothetical protein
MSRYTVLVLASTGKISAIQAGQGTWGSKECPPVFELIETDITPEVAEWLLKFGGYNFDTKEFVHRDTGEIFNEQTDLIESKIYDTQLTRNDGLAEGLGSESLTKSCDFLRASHIGEHEDDRIYWIRRFYPLRKEKGVMALIQAARSGLYADARAAFDALDEEIKTKILNSGDVEDKSYMEWFGLTELEVTTR